ncbi:MULTISPECIES: GDSL-type esterase/lipase family protein [Janibacter]|jgi:lysophospholipase L1-like esterase|uniref:G-D-S-L family lipolytic protein n=1 Tax=Janibacter melonis TaxID=262209 RepID=A0A5P8FPJ6_9MICO|nr:GDSL-type esterase/lipase family protein [Janibacter melonis]MBD5830770.1 G-D-S-L family lipolytic protein [Janibacter melonis]MCM3555057.1 GDSL-type esterase/lipase family protein [Janibacter melonis]QFQ30662.2 G-D-S-L family lipolytic protein [Janibacter melonis]
MSTDPQFTPSAAVASAPGDDGERRVSVVFIGDSFVAGVGDPKAQGWVGRVMGRTVLDGAHLAHYNLGVGGQTSGDVSQRWLTEAPLRWEGASDRRLVVSFGRADAETGVSLARHRLNLANILDECASRGVAPFVVGPAPAADAEVDAQLTQITEAQRDVCERRGVPFVDVFAPLAGHEQWDSDMASSLDGVHPGQAGYGLIAWLVLHHGWSDWIA